MEHPYRSQTATNVLTYTYRVQFTPGLYIDLAPSHMKKHQVLKDCFQEEEEEEEEKVFDVSSWTTNISHVEIVLAYYPFILNHPRSGIKTLDTHVTSILLSFAYFLQNHSMCKKLGKHLSKFFPPRDIDLGVDFPLVANCLKIPNKVLDSSRMSDFVYLYIISHM